MQKSQDGPGVIHDGHVMYWERETGTPRRANRVPRTPSRQRLARRGRTLSLLLGRALLECARDGPVLHLCDARLARAL